ncbi:MAG: GNAT family N-acetyltransferase [Myxococcaceae bacterium]|nr:GNAT family N-acetyltransferase [Myxococcaceae bacterium]MCA3016896.1 GNAT family N-acetyltransferase [Myxococcaceae bacterium]
MSAAEFTWLPFGALSGRQVHDVLRLRQRVFVVEQRCAYLDADGLDPSCWHGLGVAPGGALVATARIVPPGLAFEVPAIGRVVTSPEHRRRGLGRALMLEAIRQTKRLYPGQDICLGAQRYLEGFYGSLGFAVDGAPYDEDGIPHVPMRRPG